MSFYFVSVYSLYCHLTLSLDICISCGTTNIVAEHPLFHGGLCKPCKVSY